MSIRHVAAVLDLQLPPNLKLVALVYAESANDEDDLVWLSRGKVAARSGYSERQVVALTKTLREDRRLLVEVPVDEIPPQAMTRLRGIPRNRWPSVYRVSLTEGQLSHPSPVGVKSARDRGAVSSSPEVKPASPKPEREPESRTWAEEIRYEVPSGATPTPIPHVWKVSNGSGDSEVRDLLWEALVSECRIDSSQLPDSARGVLNRSVSELRRAGADPLEVRRRAAAYRAGKGSIVKGSRLTHRALVTHWPTLGGTPDVERAAAAEAEAHVHSWRPHFRNPAVRLCDCGENLTVTDETPDPLTPETRR